MILRIEAPGMPWLSFEWHPGDHKLYVLKRPEKGNGVTMATSFLDDVQTEREAQQGVSAFLSGYRECRGPTRHVITLDTGRVGAHHGP